MAGKIGRSKKHRFRLKKKNFLINIQKKKKKTETNEETTKLNDKFKEIEKV